MARKKYQEEHYNHEAWAIPYGDLITLLLALFVVLYAVSTINEGKYRVLSDSLTAAFRGTPSTLTPLQMGGGAGNQPPQTIVGLAPSQALKLPNPTRSGAEQLPITLRKMADEVEAAMAPLIEDNLISVKRNALWVEVDIKSEILFDSGSAEMSPKAIPILEQLGRILRPLENPIRVEGHTDNRPINNVAFPSNWELSAARSARIVRLFAQIGVDPTRMVAAGLSEYQPIADNSAADGRNSNRRVTLVITDTVATLNTAETDFDGATQ